MSKRQVYIVSELCGQWGGSVRKAEQMILQSKMAGANAVKVQLWDTYRMPGDNRELWEYLTMSRRQFKRLHNFSKKLNIDFFASPFHEDRFDWIIKEKIKTNKIASSMIEWDFDFCKKMIDSGIQTYCSLGKWDKKDFPFDNKNVLYMHCYAKYPHTYKEAVEQMPLEFNSPLIGYSDHSIGIGACVEAVTRGATVLEKHFTLDHDLQCKTESAHTCSMDYDGLCNLRKQIDKLTQNL
jgi:sialic acid synthase SpsE